MWTDSCYRFVDFSVDRLADLVDRICGQILVINSGQILWTNLCTFVWQIFVTDSIDKNTNLDIEILLTEFVDKFVQPWQTFFRRTCWKEYQRFSFQQGGEICFLCGINFVLFWQTCWKEYHRFSFQQGGEEDRVNPQGKISNF